MKKVGILGGGQLGRMLLQAAANYPAEVHVMDTDLSCPAAAYCKHFTQGDIRHYEDVMNFGKHLDVLTIEIEQVNLQALVDLENLGVSIFPKPSALRIIQNKILQKNYYKENDIPSSAFIITESLLQLQNHGGYLPAVHKLAEGGYDGKGVQLIRNIDQLTHGFDAPSVLEKMVDIKQEIAVIVAVSSKNEIRIYPAVEMIFDPDLNLLSHQICPARLAEKTNWKVEAIAIQAVKKLNSPGLFAVEMFVDQDDQVWINEMAPRVHNSGHHTIEGVFSSQFDMLWRILLDYPMGNTDLRSPSALVNLIGEAGHIGEVDYSGLDEILAMDQAYVHLYGKSETRPGRKMGHVTLLGKDYTDLNHQVNLVKQHLKVISKK